MDSQGTQQVPVTGLVKAGRRSARRRRQPYAWLGASALTLGVGVALAGAGTAHADDSPAVDSARSANGSTSSAPASRGPARRAGDSAVAGSSAGQRAATPSTASVPGGGGRSAASVAQRTQGFAAPGSAATATQPLGAASVASRAARSAVIRAARPIPAPGAPAAFAVSGARQAWEAFTSRPFNQFVEGLVLGRTAEIPKTTIVVQGKPIMVGNAILANAFFDGYDGSPTGLAGLGAYITAQIEASPLALVGDPNSGFTINNMTTPASYTAGGETQQFRGMSGDTYEVAYYAADPKAYFKPGVGVPIETAFGESTQLTANQWWPSSSEVPLKRTLTYSDGVVTTYEYSGSASNTTTVAFNKTGYAPFGLESQIYNYLPAAAGVAVSPDGQTLYAVSYSTNKLWAFNTADNTVKSSWNLIGIHPTKIAVDKDGYVYVAVGANEWGDTNYGHVEYIAPTGGSVKKIDLALKDPQGITTNADGTYIYVADAGSNQLSIIPSYAIREEDTTRVNVGAKPLGVVSNTGTGAYRNGLIYVSNSDYENPAAIHGSVDVVRQDGTVGTVVASIGGFSNPYGLALTPDGRYLYVANESSGYVSQVDTTTNEIVNTIKVGNNPRSVIIRPGPDLAVYPAADPYTVYVTNFGDNTVSSINPAGAVVDIFGTGGSGTDSIAMTPPNPANGRNTLYTGNYFSGTVSIIGNYTNGQTPNASYAWDPAYLVDLATTTTASGTITYVYGIPSGGPVYTTTSTATCRAGSTGSAGGCSVFNTTPTDTTLDFVNDSNTFITVDKLNDEWGFVQGNIMSNVVYPQNGYGGSGTGSGSFVYKAPPAGEPGSCSSYNCNGYSNYGRVAGIPIKFNESGGTNTYTWSTATAVAQATSTTKGFTFNASTTGTKIQKDVWSLAGTAGVSYTNTTAVSTTESTTVTDTNSFTIPAGYEAVVLGAWEVIKWFGDWTVTDARSRTTYTLPNVWYATPANGGGQFTEGPYGCKVGSAACASLEQGIIPGFTAENPAPADYGIPTDINDGLYYDNPFQTGITPISQLDTSTGSWTS
jgi:YVTN family beta-propeller protein